MDIVELIQNNGKCGFSFEVLPPLKGKGIVQIYNAIDKLKEFDPLYINITTHRSEYVFKSNDDGTYQRVSERSRPGTVAVAAAMTTEIWHSCRAAHHLQRFLEKWKQNMRYRLELWA